MGPFIWSAPVGQFLKCSDLNGGNFPKIPGTVARLFTGVYPLSNMTIEKDPRIGPQRIPGSQGRQDQSMAIPWPSVAHDQSAGEPMKFLHAHAVFKGLDGIWDMSFHDLARGFEKHRPCDFYRCFRWGIKEWDRACVCVHVLRPTSLPFMLPSVSKHCWKQLRHVCHMCLCSNGSYTKMAMLTNAYQKIVMKYWMLGF